MPVKTTPAVEKFEMSYTPTKSFNHSTIE